MLTVVDIRHHLFLGGAIAPELVGDHHPRLAVWLDQLGKKTLGRLLVAPFLNHDIEHVTMLIHGAPEIENLAVDLDHHLIKVPLVTHLWSIAADRVGKERAELSFPVPHRLVAGLNATIGEQFLDIAKAQAEAIIKPDGLADDLARKAVAFERIRARFRHAIVLQTTPFQANRTPT